MSWVCFLMQGDEAGIFSKATDWKTLFLVKIKIKKNLGCLNKEYNVIFEQHSSFESMDELGKVIF